MVRLEPAFVNDLSAGVAGRAAVPSARQRARKDPQYGTTARIRLFARFRYSAVQEIVSASVSINAMRVCLWVPWSTRGRAPNWSWWTRRKAMLATRKRLRLEAMG